IHFILLFSRQGKLRLQKWYTTLPDKERKKITREIVQIILSRGQRTSSFVDWKELKLVYKRYASLYFCCAVENQDNELLTLEIVHRYVELLDKYFGNDSECWLLLMRLLSVLDSCSAPALNSEVCELDIIFNFEKAYFILDEFIMGGEIQETSKKTAVKAIEDSDMLQEVSTVSNAVGKDGGGFGVGAVVVVVGKDRASVRASASLQGLPQPAMWQLQENTSPWDLSSSVAQKGGGRAQVGAPELDTGIDGRRHEDARTARTNRQNCEDRPTGRGAAAAEREEAAKRGIAVDWEPSVSLQCSEEARSSLFGVEGVSAAEETMEVWLVHVKEETRRQVGLDQKEGHRVSSTAAAATSAELLESSPPLGVRAGLKEATTRAMSPDPPVYWCGKPGAGEKPAGRGLSKAQSPVLHLWPTTALQAEMLEHLMQIAFNFTLESSVLRLCSPVLEFAFAARRGMAHFGPCDSRVNIEATLREAAALCHLPSLCQQSHRSRPCPQHSWARSAAVPAAGVLKACELRSEWLWCSHRPPCPTSNGFTAHHLASARGDRLCALKVPSALSGRGLTARKETTALEEG
ncbi:AP-1 complex subunit sigma-3, partial [Galemys pyrenaicus]